LLISRFAFFAPSPCRKTFALCFTPPQDKEHIKSTPAERGRINNSSAARKSLSSSLRREAFVGKVFSLLFDFEIQIFAQFSLRLMLQLDLLKQLFRVSPARLEGKCFRNFASCLLCSVAILQSKSLFNFTFHRKLICSQREEDWFNIQQIYEEICINSVPASSLLNQR
jgi:hypothetical protein